jgi:hypothetical protein
MRREREERKKQSKQLIDGKDEREIRERQSNKA